jgi:hypothetical protein
MSYSIKFTNAHGSVFVGEEFALPDVPEVPPGVTATFTASGEELAAILWGLRNYVHYDKYGRAADDYRVRLEDGSV